jgi:hypothetical protein
VERKRLPISVLIALAAVMTVAGFANAGTLADSTVTMKAQSGDFSGTISSSRPMRCAQDRKVVVFKQAGANQDPSQDNRVASDTASLSGDRYEWSTGNTGVYGKVYARVGRTEHCKADTSRTVRSVRP